MTLYPPNFCAQKNRQNWTDLDEVGYQSIPWMIRKRSRMVKWTLTVYHQHFIFALGIVRKLTDLINIFDGDTVKPIFAGQNLIGQ